MKKTVTEYEPTLVDYTIDYYKKADKNFGVIRIIGEVLGGQYDAMELPLGGNSKFDLIYKAVRSLNVDEHISGFFDEYIKKIEKVKSPKKSEYSALARSLKNAYNEAREDIERMLKLFEKNQKGSEIMSRWVKIMDDWAQENIKPANLRQETNGRIN